MASTVSPRQRAFALTIALIFLITTIATSVLVVMAIVNENKNSSQTVDLNNADDSSAIETQNENSLQGTQLADFTPVDKVDSLQIIDTKVGTGAVVEKGATITAHYTGAVASTGVIFQSSRDGGQPIAFGLDQVIKGWTDGVPGMKEGGTRRLIIPAEQAYGATPPEGSGIPANAALVFDIELVKIGE